MNRQTSHISNYILQAYLDQDLDQARYQEVELHLDQCLTCREELSRLEGVFSRLENLPSLELEKDLSTSVLAQLRDEKKISLGITWTLVLEAIGAGTVIGLLIPVFQAAAWLPQLIDTQTEIQAAVNIFLTQLASSWLVWWTGLQLNIEQTAKSVFSTSYFPSGEFSPWILILAAAGIGLLANYILLLLSILALITLAASFIFIRGLFPVRVSKIQVTLEDNWKRSFWLGLVNTILITIFVVGFGSLGNGSPIFYIPAFAMYGAFLIGLLFGLSAFIQILGERLFPDLNPVKRDVKAGAIFLLTSLLPFVGWFLLFPYVLSLSVGAVVITLFQNRKRKEKE